MKLQSYINSLKKIIYDQSDPVATYDQIAQVHKNIYSWKQLSKLSPTEIQKLLFDEHRPSDLETKYFYIMKEFLAEVIAAEALNPLERITGSRLLGLIERLETHLQLLKREYDKLLNPEQYIDISYFEKLSAELSTFEAFVKFVTTIKAVLVIGLSQKYTNHEQALFNLNILLTDIHQQFQKENLSDQLPAATNLNSLPLELSIESKIVTNNSHSREDNFYAKAEHIEIVNKGFEEFLSNLASIDPGGDFTNLIQFVGDYDDDFPDDNDDGLRIKFPIYNNGPKLLALSPGQISILPAVFPSQAGPISFIKPAKDDVNIFNLTPDQYKQMALQNLYDGIKKPDASINPLLHYQRLTKAVNFEGQVVEGNSISFRRDDSASPVFKLIKNKGENPDDFCHGNLDQQFSDNFDHYQNEAIEIFRLGLDLAISKAKVASHLTKEEEKEALLTEAIINTLYACHFLVDYYLSGHHVPKKELLNVLHNNPIETIPELEKIPTTQKMLAAFLTKEMHDENSKQGIVAKNQKRLWSMYENDLAMYDNKNSRNFQIAADSVALALNDIYLTFTGNPDNKPLFKDSYHETLPDIQFKHPMFKLSKDKSTLKMRKGDNYEPLVNLENPTNLLNLLGQFAIIKVRQNHRRTYAGSKPR